MPDWHKVRRCGLEMFAVETYGGRREEIKKEGGFKSIRNSETLWIC